MTFSVNVEYTDGTEDELEVDIDLDIYAELELESEKIEYVKDLAKGQSDNVKKVLFGNDELEILESEIDDMLDTSDILPNEEYEDYMEHEAFD